MLCRVAVRFSRRKGIPKPPPRAYPIVNVLSGRALILEIDFSPALVPHPCGNGRGAQGMG